MNSLHWNVMKRFKKGVSIIESSRRKLQLWQPICHRRNTLAEFLLFMEFLVYLGSRFLLALRSHPECVKLWPTRIPWNDLILPDFPWPQDSCADCSAVVRLEKVPLCPLIWTERTRNSIRCLCHPIKWPETRQKSDRFVFNPRKWSFSHLARFVC